MLTSSDAKWRCLWYMFVWSVQLTLVSQFLFFRDHVSFYVFAVPSILVLPGLTAIYSNTAGKHGAGILRVGYVICDPVLACLTITPILVLNHLPADLEQRDCFHFHQLYNDTVECLKNATKFSHYQGYVKPSPSDWKNSFLTIQCFLLIPVFMAMLMWRRTRKMAMSTYLLSTVYWSAVAIESADLLQLVIITPSSRHGVFTVIAMISIVTVVANSYAIVTLCSYVTPMTSSLARSEKVKSNRFDTAYTFFVGICAIIFVQVPLIAARFQLIAKESRDLFSGVFYMWLVHDMTLTLAIPVYLFSRRLGRRCMKLQCGPQFDNTEVFFQPEKRDAYIMRTRRGVRKSVSRQNSSSSSSALMTSELLPVCESTLCDIKRSRQISETITSEATVAKSKNGTLPTGSCDSEMSPPAVASTTVLLSPDSVVQDQKKKTVRFITNGYHSSTERFSDDQTSDFS